MKKNMHAVMLGRKGGAAKSAAKRAAGRKNLAKARLKRWAAIPLDIKNRLV